MPSCESCVVYSLFRLHSNISAITIIVMSMPPLYKTKMLIILHLKKHQTIHFVTAAITASHPVYFVVFSLFQTTDYRNTNDTTYTISFCRNGAFFSFLLFCVSLCDINYIIRFCSFIFIITSIVLAIYSKLVLIIWI